MHLVLCGAGTALAMAGHARRARLYLPHLLGLLTMAAVSYDLGGAMTRWVGVAALGAVTIAVIGGLDEFRERAESVIDNVAMVLLVIAMPAMTAAHTAPHHAMGGAAMSEPSTSLTIAIVTVLAWGGARIIVLGLASAPARHVGGSSHRMLVGLAGSALMVTGMTLMSV